MTCREFVYVVAWGDLVKVGRSVDPQKRVAQLRPPIPQSGRPELIGWVFGDAGAERLLLAALEDAHIGGEWHRRTPAVERVVARLMPRHVGNWHIPIPEPPPRPPVVIPEDIEF
jgi:hypothetical protein